MGLCGHVQVRHDLGDSCLVEAVVLLPSTTAII